MKLKKFLQNFSLTIASNLLSLITSVIVILIVPKIIGVYEYGLWQLFIFYSSYIGVLHCGWIDGIYLRYGGITYKGLDKSAMAGQFLYLLVSQAIVTVLMIIILGPLIILFFQKQYYVVVGVLAYFVVATMDPFLITSTGFILYAVTYYLSKRKYIEFVD